MAKWQGSSFRANTVDWLAVRRRANSSYPAWVWTLQNANIMAGLLAREPEPIAACCSTIPQGQQRANHAIKMWSVSSRKICLIMPRLWQLMPGVLLGVCLKQFQMCSSQRLLCCTEVTEFSERRRRSSSGEKLGRMEKCIILLANEFLQTGGGGANVRKTPLFFLKIFPHLVFRWLWRKIRIGSIGYDWFISFPYSSNHSVALCVLWVRVLSHFSHNRNVLL